MDNGLHFISGLPRSGSTLLAAILRQNPRFHAAMSSPVGSLFMAPGKREMQRVDTEEMLRHRRMVGVLQHHSRPFVGDLIPDDLSGRAE